MRENITEKILFIAPYKEMGDIAKKIAVKLGINLLVEVAFMEDVLSLIEKIKEMGINFVVARGATAAIIKNNSNLHVIEIYQNDIEILRAIQKAINYGSEMALVWYNQNLYKEDLDYHLSQLDVHFHSYQTKRDIEDIVKSIKEENIDIIIGGIYTKIFAERLGMKAILVESDEQSIYLTLTYAKEIIEVKRLEEVKRLKLEAVVDNVHDGIISVNGDGTIVAFNLVAENIMNLKSEDVVGKNIDEVIHPAFVKKIKEDDMVDQLIDVKTAKISVNSNKIKLNGKIVATVFTFQDITKIRLLEEKIRMKMLKRGHIAKYNFDDIIGKNPALLGAKEISMKYAITDETILITGETGTGKEMFAQSIHNYSNRKESPFIAVNCAELSENLFESELFGYEEGAFTGAKKGGKDGLFALAHRGTIFLDEISEIPMHLQTTILRVLEERVVRPLGSDKITPIDVRVVAASNKDLYQMVIDNEFRKDLFYRLNVLNVQIPSLKDRCSDIPLILKHLGKLKGFNFRLTSDGMKLLKNYSWPGNIRELINFFTRLIITYEDRDIDTHHILEIMPEISTLSKLIRKKDWNKGEIKTLDETVKEAILLAMEEYNGNQSEVSRVLGVSRTFIWKKLKEM